MNSFTRLLWVLLSITALAGSDYAYSRPLSYDKYDVAIYHAVRMQWNRCEPDWHWWKAQLYQESRLDPDAVSPVGARGLAQFMPGTWNDVTQSLGWSGISSRAVQPAIQAGAYYMERLCRSWSSPRPSYDRLALAQASYNAGLGNMLRAQRKCGGPALYVKISACLPQVTGHHAQETLQYVERISQWKKELDHDSR